MMKIKILFFCLFLTCGIMDAQKEKIYHIKRTMVELSGRSYYVYDIDDSCIFTEVDPKSGKEKLLPVCHIEIYDNYIKHIPNKNTVQTELSLILKSVDKPELFKNLVIASYLDTENKTNDRKELSLQ
ncbi:hypothetical protein HZQ46_14335 [Elizabethkingia anophelis]|uniref:hypothetical protein n=3 Tax=Weeksellaceae TaxID=2762318 RepID=UPI000ADB8CB7|nr:hypothetical protein [Elizabethkingia anophelis]MCT3853158.1 hypothetical protein [Elizabethkingia anophelis]MCT4323408.1 hypothetical protein [Elizabethkingia anophelis]UKY91992.1 hypothetical protein KUF67_09740 [Elizabethkingia anophelis]CAH1150926.1 hypothetical protein EAVNVH72_01489 [Elizabethkingia anophelis]CAI9682371.1 hypothetical protein EAVNVH72_01995 [Elizabethkingia anophelis]